MNIHADSSNDASDLQLSMKTLKALAKVLRKRSSELGYNHCLERLCRSAGYTGYFEASHHPRVLRVSLQRWREGLHDHLQVALEPQLTHEEIETWYGRLFRPTRPHLEEPGEDGGEHIPAFADHLRTTADALAQPARRTRRAF